MRDPELVARAQRAAARLESAWEQWRALHGLAVAPGQPVVSYVGYSLKEPWGEPRVVIGIDADEAEFLAEFLDRDECGSTAQMGAGQMGAAQMGAVQMGAAQMGAGQMGGSQMGAVQVPRQSPAADQPQPPTTEFTSSTLLGAPVPGSHGRPAAASGDIAAELAGWSSGELPGQASEQLAGWTTAPGMPPSGAHAAPGE